MSLGYTYLKSASLTSLEGIAPTDGNFIVGNGTKFVTEFGATARASMGVTIDDTAYNATSWNTNTDAATKNAVRDKVETMDTAIGSNTEHRGLNHNYAHITGNDGATDVTSAELEELTDGSETTKHSHAAAASGFDSKFSVYKSTSFTVNSDAWTTAVLSSEFYDGLNEYDNVTNYRFTASVTGYYHFTANCDVASLGSDKAFQARFTKNGIEAIQTGRPGQGNASASGTYTRAHISQSVYLETNDYVEVEVWHNHGSSRTCGQGISTFTGERFA